MADAALPAGRRSLLIGVAGPTLASVRALHGEPITKLAQPQLATQHVAPGERVFLGAFSSGRQLELLGALRVGHRDGAVANAAPPLTRCDSRCIVPHDLARRLRDTAGAGLRFARSQLYELHPAALLRPISLSTSSANALSEMLIEVDEPSYSERSGRDDRSASIPDLGLSARATNALMTAGVVSLAQLRELDSYALSRIPNLGVKSVQEVQSRLGRDPAPARSTGGLRPNAAIEGLPTRISNALGRHGITNIEALRATPPTRLESMSDLGSKAIAEVAEFLLSDRAGTRVGDADVFGIPEWLPVSAGVAEALAAGGYDDRDSLLGATRSDLAALPGVGASGAAEIAEALARSGALLPRGDEGGRPLVDLELAPEVLAALVAAGETTVEALAERSARELRAVPGVGTAGVRAIVTSLERAGSRSAAASGGSDRNIAIARECLAGATLQEIADRHNITRERVRQISKEFGVSGAVATAARRASKERHASQHVEELRRRYRSGEDIAASARALELARGPADDVLKRSLTPTDRAVRGANSARALPAAARLEKDKQLLKAIVGLAVANGGEPPTTDQYRIEALRLGLPGPQTVMTRFGSWTAAIEAAGLRARPPKRNYTRIWDDRRCRAAALAAARELGRWPSVAEYERMADGRADLPSSATLRNRLGAWSAIGLDLAIGLEGGPPADPDESLSDRRFPSEEGQG